MWQLGDGSKTSSYIMRSNNEEVQQQAQSKTGSLLTRSEILVAPGTWKTQNIAASQQEVENYG
jgi:hypothetical protein